MATGVKPRDEETQLTRSDLDAIQDAMKNKKFRDMLADYCEEVSDPANQAIYQKEMVQLEKERGYDVTFINPKGGYVIKTSVAGDRKAFINICSNDNIQKPSCKIEEVNGRRGMNWSIPYSLIPPREDYDSKRERCVIYDVVFHPDTLRMAEVNKKFRELVNKTAFDGLQKTYNIHLDSNNLRFPKSYYKGMNTPAVIRKEDPNFKPPTEEELEELQMTPEMIEKLFPQKMYSQKGSDEKPNQNDATQLHPRKSKKFEEFIHKAEGKYTIPKYIIKQQKNIDFQDYTYHRDSKQYSAIPSQIVVEINLPLLSSTSDCTLDVDEKRLSLVSEKPAKYKLDIPLPYSVNDQCGSAKFDKSKRKLIVTLPVIKKDLSSEHSNSLKVDSGVDSEEYSGSQSDEEREPPKVIELSSTANDDTSVSSNICKPVKTDSFLDNSLHYIVPSYTYNILDDAVAFTFHVKNTEPDSVQVKNEDNKAYIKFTSMGSGYVPVHYATVIEFSENVKFENATGEAWDNNVILQLELIGKLPQEFQIGLNDSMTTEYLGVSHAKVAKKTVTEKPLEDVCPVVEVTNSGSETNILVSSNHDDDDEDNDEDDDSMDSPTSLDKEIVWTESYESNAKSILRKPMMRSFSESSYGDMASSMDYISSDCIPEESSLKKTVRFNDVISKQFYRYNSSIEGQKKKNQRKKSKKRNLERRKSESEAEEESNNTQVGKPRLKSALKQRRDSGLADTSDAEDCKNTPDDRSYTSEMPVNASERKNIDIDTNMTNNNSPTSILNIVDNDKQEVKESNTELWETKTEKKETLKTCEKIKHNTDLYNPDRLNKGQYLEVSFKNDLIFDLDM